MSHEEKSPDRKINLDELFKYDMHLVTYHVRYGGPGVGLFIAGHLGHLSEVADDMTSAGDYCDHITTMLCGTDYFPWGEGDTFQDALDQALKRINRYRRRQWFEYAYHEVLNAPLAYPDIKTKYIDWAPLPSMEELMKKPLAYPCVLDNKSYDPVRHSW